MHDKFSFRKMGFIGPLTQKMCQKFSSLPIYRLISFIVERK